MLILRELTILCNLNITMKEADSFMNSGIEFAQKINLAYNSVCKPLLHKFNLPQTAFDILMFLANNPEYTTARDIVEVRKINGLPRADPAVLSARWGLASGFGTGPGKGSGLCPASRRHRQYRCR